MAGTRDRRSARSPRRDEISTPGRAPPRSEWIVAALGAILVLGTIAQLLYTALWRDLAPPDIEVVAGQVIELDKSWLVLFRARNQGSSAAAQVEVEGALGTPDGWTEVSGATLDYLPPGSDREGGLVFTRDPHIGQLHLRAKGFVTP